MDYLEFHKLQSEPFQNALDARFYFESRAQRQARMRLERGMSQQRGLLALVGEPGCGKTTLAHQLSVSLDPERFWVHLLVIPHAACASGWLLPKLAQAFGSTELSRDPVRLIEQIHYALLVARSRGRHPVLIVDEAQMLASHEVMQEFRGLLNLIDDGRPLLTIALCGLFELDRVLRLDAPLAQRVEVRCALAPLEQSEVEAYVAHRLERAGGTGSAFEREALSALARLSQGIPRVLNTLADTALFESALEERSPVTLESVLAAAEQLGLVEAAPEAAPPAIPSPVQPLAAVSAEPRPAPVPVAAPAPAAAPAPVAARAPAAPRMASPALGSAPITLASVPASPAPAPAPAPVPAAALAETPAPATPEPAPAAAPAAPPPAAPLESPAGETTVEESDDGLLDLGGLLELDDPDESGALGEVGTPAPEVEVESSEDGGDLDDLFAQIQRPE